MITRLHFSFSARYCTSMGYNNNGSVQQVEHQPQIRAKYELQAKDKTQFGV